MALPVSSGIKLASAPKKYSAEQDKTRPPAETVAWVRERFASLGRDVLKKTMRIDTGRLDIPVYISLCGADATRTTGTAKQMGKGAAPAQAEASALMELAERYSFFSFMQNNDFPVARAGEINGLVMDFARVAASVHHPEKSLDKARRVFELLPQSWAPAKNLALDRDEMIPLGWFYAINEYNGPAAGNCQEEALLQSLCEVVERHVSALVTLEKRPTPAIDPASVTDPVAADLIAKFEKAGIKVFLKDFTCGMGIPTVAALCFDPESFPEKSEIVYTAGTATSPAKALIRALTEVAQLAGDFENATSYMVSALPKFQSLDEAAYVTRSGGLCALSDLPDVSRDDLKDEVTACVKALDAIGYAVYSLDVTHPGLLVPAVYTIIPGAHFAQRTTGTDVIFHAAKLASQLEDPETALETLEYMSRIADSAYYLPFFKGLALLNLERPLEALAELNAALKLGPPASDEASVHTQIGVALKDLGRFKEAKGALLLAAGFSEPHHEVFNLLGFCHFKLEEYAEAVEAFSRAIEIEPGDGINYANLAVNLERLGKTEEAAAMYRNALEMDPGLDFARQNLARLES